MLRAMAEPRVGPAAIGLHAAVSNVQSALQVGVPAAGKPRKFAPEISHVAVGGVTSSLRLSAVSAVARIR